MSGARERILEAARRHTRADLVARMDAYRPAVTPPAAGSDEVVAAFTAAATEADAVVVRAGTLADAIDALGPELEKGGGARVAVDVAADELAAILARFEERGIDAIDGAGAIEALATKLRELRTAEARRPAADALSAFDAVLSFADAAIADTGTLVFRPGSLDRRRLLALATHQLAIVRRPAIVADPWVLQDMDGPRGDLLLVTGPSRTADIEKQIVLGAHGPSRLTIAVID